MACCSLTRNDWTGSQPGTDQIVARPLSPTTASRAPSGRKAASRMMSCFVSIVCTTSAGLRVPDVQRVRVQRSDQQRAVGAVRECLVDWLSLERVAPARPVSTSTTVTRLCPVSIVRPSNWFRRTATCRPPGRNARLPVVPASGAWPSAVACRVGDVPDFELRGRVAGTSSVGDGLPPSVRTSTASRFAIGAEPRVEHVPVRSSRPW